MLTSSDRRPPIVCVSSMGWSFLWTRKQRFMAHLARRGWRVLYVEPPESVLAPLRQPEKARALVGGGRLKYLEDPGLHVLTPRLGVPGAGGYAPPLQFVRYRSLYKTIARTIRRLGWDRPIHWTYTVDSAQHLEVFPVAATIYDCVDLVSHYPGVNALRAQALEERLCQASDLVFTSASTLVAHLTPYSRSVSFISNGYDPSLSDPPSRDEACRLQEILPWSWGNGDSPIVSYVGGIYEWVDLAVLHECALASPDMRFVIAGPVGRGVDVSSLSSLPNVHLTGRLTQESVRALLHSSAAALSAFKNGPLAEHVNPLKVYEYLAVGLPVVSTRMPELESLGEVIEFVDEGGSFAEHLCRAVATDTSALRAARQERVRAYGWDHLSTRMERELEHLVGGR